MFGFPCLGPFQGSGVEQKRSCALELQEGSKSTFARLGFRGFRACAYKLQGLRFRVTGTREWKRWGLYKSWSPLSSALEWRRSGTFEASAFRVQGALESSDLVGLLDCSCRGFVESRILKQVQPEARQQGSPSKSPKAKTSSAPKLR